MEVITTTNYHVDSIKYNYILHSIKCLFYFFIAYIITKTITKTISRLNHLEEKINQQLLDIANNIKENKTEIHKINTDITILGKQINNNKKRIGENFKTFMETHNNNIEIHKKNNFETILNIQNFVDRNIQSLLDRNNEKICEYHEKINEFNKYTNIQLNEYEKKCNECQFNMEILKTTINSLNKQFNKITTDIEKKISVIDNTTNQKIQTLNNELQNHPNSYSLIPISGGLVNYCDINSEKLILVCQGNGMPIVQHISLCTDNIDNILSYDITKLLKSNNAEILDGLIKFLKQLTKIKSLHFEFNYVCTNECIRESHLRRCLNMLFNTIIDIFPSMDIYYRCKDLNPTEQFTPDILKEFINTNKYSSFHLEIKNNYTKDGTTGIMRLIDCPIGKKIKGHCLKNNIKFESNIGI